MPNHRLHAAIHLGAHSVRLVIAERVGRRGYRAIEHLQVPLLLGQDTFNRGRVGHELIRETCAILRKFRDKLAEYGIEPPTVIATSAVREASNRDTFVDRVQQTTGFRVEVIEPMDETRLIHRLVQELIGRRFGMNKGASMVLSLGGGGSQIIMFQDGEVVFSESRKVGTVRLREMISADGQRLGEDLDLFVTNVAQTFGLLHNLGSINTFVVINNTLHDLLPALLDVKVEEKALAVTGLEIDRLAKSLQGESLSGIQARLQVSADDAEMLMVALPQVHAFLGITSAKRVVLPDATFIDALIIDEIAGEKEADMVSFARQVESAAVHLGRKYQFHEKHALHVRGFAQRIFDDLKSLHGLDQRRRLDLTVAALLHDIGWFVSAQGHHKHSAYIINASEILGLDEEERMMVSLVARFHRRTPPRVSNPEFTALPRDRRTEILKMAALLRLADALDRDLSQSVAGVNAMLNDDEVTLEVEVPTQRRATFPLIERAVLEKAALFKETFGTDVHLRLKAAR